MKKSLAIFLGVFSFILLTAIWASKSRAAEDYSYNDNHKFKTGNAKVWRMVDPENGVVCYTATEGGLGISISCLQTK